MRRRGAGARAARRRGAADAGHPARLHAGGGARDRRVGRALPRPRRRRRRARRARGGVPARAVRGGVRARALARPRLGPARGRGRRARLRARRARGARRRPAAARHPRRRGCRPRPRARRARNRPRRLPPLESPHRRGRVPGRAPAPTARRRGRPLLDLDRRPGHVRHRSHPRLRGGRVARPLPARRLRSRGRGRPLRRGDTRPPRRRRRRATPGVRVSPRGGRERSGAGRLAARGARGGTRPRGPARRLPEHAHHARRRGARPHPLPAGQDPRLVLHRPRERGSGRRRRDGDGPGRRGHAAPSRHGRAHHARRPAVAHLRAVHGPAGRPDARPRRQRAHGGVDRSG